MFFKEFCPVRADGFSISPVEPDLMRRALECMELKIITGLCHFEMSLNGKKVGDHFLDAGWTKYDKQALYVAFDLTNELKLVAIYVISSACFSLKSARAR